MGGGSSSSSDVSQEIDQSVINRSTINTLNKMVNDVAVNTLIQNVKNCSATIVNTQRIVFKNLRSAPGKDITINVNQNQSAWLNLSCAQRDEIKNEVISKMIDTVKEALSSTVQQEAMAKLNATASSKSEEGWLAMPWGGASSDSSVSQKIKTYIENNKTTNVENVVENAVYANFTNSNYSECIGKIINSQEIVAENLDSGGAILFTADQTQAANLLTQCIQESDVTNRAANDVARFLDLTIKEDVKQTATAGAEGTAESIAVRSGISLGMSSASSGSSLLILIIGGLLFLLYLYLSKKGKGGSSGASQSQGYSPGQFWPSG